MHRAQLYFDTVINPGGNAPAGVVLNAGMAGTLELELVEDAKSYLYSAIVSVGDAIQAIQNELFSWSTVKLYYAVFYALRATLAAHKYAIIYHVVGQKGTPYRLRAAPGEVPAKLSGNTHKVILQQYSTHFPGAPMVTQLIGTDTPFDWIMDRREEVNYKIAKFREPEAPTCFKKIASENLRRLLPAYINDSSATFAFDPEHAILALPIAAIQTAKAAFAAKVPPTSLTAGDASFLAGLFRDRHGQILAARDLLP
ncbi:hypothetical protein [Pseudacidovorax sp. NFM-22]|uniref:hypothetical protein n=1 Tax=Pseudacidovorax sp. NFM-22 TaxID=2744469 RepID=UPI001F45B31E|nr:hypothetical protein [Pseudacidovorax sp. NFM-22]